MLTGTPASRPLRQRARQLANDIPGHRGTGPQRRPTTGARRRPLHHPGRRYAKALGVTLLVALLLTVMPGPAIAQPSDVWASAEAVAVVPEAAFPTDLEIAPDGSVWYTELKGNVSRFDPATGQVENMLHVPNVVTGQELGMVGLALAHDFESSGAFYVYYSEDTGEPDAGINRLMRVVDGEMQELASLPAYREHNGGRIVVTPDGHLFVGTGENSKRDPAQDMDSLLGKILRMTPDGEPVEGNHHELVYSYGHRNVFGLALDPDTGALWAAENMGWRRDEINLIEAGGNYGYPECEGHGLNGVDDPCPTDKGYLFPVLTFYEDRAAAPTGVAFWHGDKYWSSFNEGSIHHFWEDEAGDWQDEIVFEHEAPIIAMHVTEDQEFWFAALDGIYRLDLPAPDGGGSADGGATSGNEDEGLGGGDPVNTIPASGAMVSLVMLLGALLVLRRRAR